MEPVFEPVRTREALRNERDAYFFPNKEMEKLSEAEAAKLADVRSMLEARGLSTTGRKVGPSLFAFLRFLLISSFRLN